MRYRWYLAGAAVLFLGGLALGLSTPADEPSVIGNVLVDELRGLDRFARFLQDLSTTGMLLFILTKNIVALVLSFVLSPLLGVVPIAALVLNGALLGFLMGFVASLTSVGFALSAVLPHGVIEIPALVIGEAAALSTGVAIMMVPFSIEARNELGPTLRRNLKYLGIALALLVPAAVIETFVTPLFLR